MISLGDQADTDAAVAAAKAAFGSWAIAPKAERIALVERRVEDAIAVFRRAFELRRNNLMLIQLTRALFAGGRGDEGLSMMRSWLEEFSEDLLVHNTLAETYIALSRHPEAQVQYEKILAIASNSS